MAVSLARVFMSAIVIAKVTKTLQLSNWNNIACFVAGSRADLAIFKYFLTGVKSPVIRF